jgi:hypothetical protein
MKPDDALIAWIAEADPARRAAPSESETRALAGRIRLRVLQADRESTARRARPAIATIATIGGSALVVVAVVGLILIGHHHAPTPAVTPTTPSTATQTTTGTFAALSRPRTGQDRLPNVLRPWFTRAGLTKADIGSSALVISTRTHRVWLVPAGRELCSVQMDLTAQGRFGGGGFACGQTRYSELHGVRLDATNTTFTAVLPQHTSPVQITFTDGSSTQLSANRNGVINITFTRRIRLIAYTGPTGLQIHIKPAAHDARNARPRSS